MQTDMTLLEQYSRKGDAEAFSELVRRYGRLVYWTCFRVTGNRQEAEDVSQECFFQLARNAAAVRSSLPGWLHKVARNRALNAISRDAARRRHEQEASELASSGAEPAWAEVSAVLDEAMDGLPDELREPLVQHYLSGLTQAEVAANLGVDQSTVSRHLSRAVDALRQNLAKSGIVLDAAALTACLAKAASDPVPAAAMASFGKIALSGAGGTGHAGVASVAGALAGSWAGRTALLLVCAAVLFVVAYQMGAVRLPYASSPRMAAADAQLPPRDPLALQFFLLRDTASRARPNGTWRISLPRAAGEGYLFERLESGRDRDARVVEAIDSAKQPEAIMSRVVHPESNGPVLNTNDVLPSATARVLKEGPVVDIELTERGAQVLAEVTGSHIGEQVGIFASGRLVSAPVIAQQMRVTRLQIAVGRAAEADALAKAVNGATAGQP